MMDSQEPNSPQTSRNIPDETQECINRINRTLKEALGLIAIIEKELAELKRSRSNNTIAEVIPIQQCNLPRQPTLNNLLIPISSIKMTTHLRHALHRINCLYFGDLCKITAKSFIRENKIGIKALEELELIFRISGFKLGQWINPKTLQKFDKWKNSLNAPQ